MALVFVLGVGNFALQRAVLDCGHPALAGLSAAARKGMARAALFAEFVVLAGALYMVASGHRSWGWAYLGYSLFNGAAGWALIKRRP